MLKSHCDKCEKIIEEERFTVEYRNYKTYAWEKIDLCKNCLPQADKVLDKLKLKTREKR